MALTPTDRNKIMSDALRISGRVHVCSPSGSIGADGLTAETATTLLDATNRTVSGDAMFAVEGTYTITVLNRPSGVDLFGAGRGKTIINGDADEFIHGCVVPPSTGSRTRHLTINSTIHLSTPGNYGSPFGFIAPLQPVANNWSASDLELNGDADAILFQNKANASAPPQCHGSMSDIYGTAGFDSFNVLDNSNRAWDVVIDVDRFYLKVTQSPYFAGIQRGAVISSGTVTLRNGIISVTSTDPSTTLTNGVILRNNFATNAVSVLLNNVGAFVSGQYGSVAALNNAAVGTNCSFVNMGGAYDMAKTAGSIVNVANVASSRPATNVTNIPGSIVNVDSPV